MMKRLILLVGLIAGCGYAGPIKYTHSAEDIASSLYICDTNDGPIAWYIQFPIKLVQSETKTNDVPLRVSANWIVETNDFPGSPDKWGLTFTSTNLLIDATHYIPTVEFSCPREHVDRSTHADTKYVTSNLVVFTVWKGQTNKQYLESIPVTNLVRAWHFEQTKVYDK